MKQVYIVAAKRTPIGKFGGAFKNVSPIVLGAQAMKAVLNQAGISGSELDLYIMGNVLRSGHGQLLPRQAAFQAGIPDSVDGYAVDMVCSSAMMAAINASSLIKAGDADLILAGGMESMSQAGFALSHRARWGYRYLAGKPEEVTDILERDGLSDPISHESMGGQTERLSADLSITRDEADKVAMQSHQRAAQATQAGVFAQEIVPIDVQSRKRVTTVREDEGIRADTTLDHLSALRPAFADNGVLTAGNSSQLSDGAAAILFASEAALKKYKLIPIGRLVSSTWSAGVRWRFALAPVQTVKQLLQKADFRLAQIDLIENNEAFATNSILFHRLLEIPYKKLNVHGGAIALGHPIGCTGIRIMVTLLNALTQHQEKYGIASLCHGTGGGTAVLLERL